MGGGGPNTLHEMRNKVQMDRGELNIWHEIRRKV